MARKTKGVDTGQVDLFDDWLVVEPPVTLTPVIPIVAVEESKERSLHDSRHTLALNLAQKLAADGEVSSRYLTDEANRVFGGSQAEGTYLNKDAYDALEAAFSIHLLGSEDADWTKQGAEWASTKAAELTNRIQGLPTQTRRDEEMEEYQQFSTPPALSFVANWVANVGPDDVMLEPSAGTGDLAIWSKIAGAKLILNELAPRRQALLGALFPEATIFKENAEQLDNVLPPDMVPTVVVMNPPFSSTAGRVQGQRDTSNGAKHIDQALRRLDDDGRLVAIVGNGMAADKPAFRQWWTEIQKKYNVRANIGISGKEYAKYGTTFDNQILVIDKNGPTTQPILVGNVQSVAELPALLEGIRNDRVRTQSASIKQTSKQPTQPAQDSVRPTNRIGGIGINPVGVRPEAIGNGADSGTGIADSEIDQPTRVGNVSDDGSGTGRTVRDNPVGVAGGSRSGDIGGNIRVDSGNETNSITIGAAASGEVIEFTDSVFANYTPQRLSIAGAKGHPGKLVQSAAMAAVEPPVPTYSPVLPPNVVNDGLLSIAQLESVVYAGQAHSEVLPNGSRRGFFIGDGTGVGKGREISGVILDNMLQSRTKAVWVSFNEGLIEDAKRDFAGVGGDPSKIFFQGKTKAGGELTQEDGILFTTYSTLRGGEKKQANDLGQKAGKSRLQQIVDWLGPDFDGAICFDEAHSMGNAIAIKGKRGVRKPSQQAIAGINLQRELPQARVMYVSATGATEISNLSYADRLGLWGEGTPFPDNNAFITEVSNGGIAAMELISRDMKAMGMYLARSLSYDGVSYERLEHNLSELQEDIYNELAGAWQVVLNNVEMALEATQAGKSGPGKSAAMAQFWGAHQRFFNQIITAMQTPAVIDDMRTQIEAGNVAVIQLVNTNEAAQERIIADATANDAALEDLDFTPRQMLMDYVRNGFPVAVYEEATDDNGNKFYRPAKDSEGNPVFDREAIALREALLETLQQIRVPENPLDSIVNAFGSEKVAEVTGRSRRFVQKRDDEGNLKVVEEKRGKNSSRSDAEAFQADKKSILIFSGAGGTGYSFHADNAAINQRKRIHYILQPGWRADSAVQGFGRTHRSNQATEPHYVLPTTNLKAQKRFVSSIARRLDQLGALTRGQREATSQGMFTASDNLESEYATTALKLFFDDLYRGKTELSFHEVTRQMGLNLLDENGSLSVDKVPAIPQFLNRLLSLTTTMQDGVFGEFEDRLIETIEYAKQQGMFDVGLQTMKALSIVKTRDSVAFEDMKTGAQTRYVELAVTNEVHYRDWDSAKNLEVINKKEGDLSGWFVSEFGRNKGEVFYMSDIGERLDSEGKPLRRGVIYTIRDGDRRYIDNADTLSRGFDHRYIAGRSQRVELTRAIDATEAEKLWREQLAIAPKTETKTERMLVGVILPIWDRVEGSETIKRLQTDEGEQLLGRMLGPKAAEQTLRNLGLNSSFADMPAAELFQAIKNGSKAVLSNGWEIATAKVNFEDRIEIKGRGYFTDGEKRLLKEQGAFVERISWTDRVFIPSGDSGVGVFERITASKPVVDLFGKKQEQQETTGNDQDLMHGVPPSDANPEPSPEPGELKAVEPPATPIETPQSVENITESDPVVFKDDVESQPVGGDVPTTHPIDISPSIDNPTEVIPMAQTKDTKDEKKPFAEIVAEKLIEQLKAGTAPWQRPWEAGAMDSFMPINPTTGKRYKGINSIFLQSQGYSDPRWMTYKQAEAIGAQVRKGEKSSPIQHWKFTEEHTKRDENGKPVLDGEGNPVKITVRLERPRPFYASVFNASQIDGLPPLERREQTWDAFERAELILEASGANISHSPSDTAFYRPSSDSIHLPDRGQFSSADKYYATALHELGHWTGHESRLDRDLSHPFGSDGYAKEELVAEIASMMVGDELGLGHDPGQHVAYVGSWIKALEEDPLEIFRAAASAEKVREYVFALEQVQLQKQERANDISGHTDELALMIGQTIETVTADHTWVNSLAQIDVINHLKDAAVAYNEDRLFDFMKTLGMAVEMETIGGGGERKHVAELADKAAVTNLTNVVTQAVDNVIADYTWSSTSAHLDVINELRYAETLYKEGRIDEFLKVIQDQADSESLWGGDKKHIADLVMVATGKQPLVEQVQPQEIGMDTGNMQSETQNGPRETARFWRQNTIEAIKGRTLESWPENVTDGELYDTLKGNSALLAQLNAKEAAIQSRYERMFSQRQESGQIERNITANHEPVQNKGGEEAPSRSYINVPFKEKNAAKALGAKWDGKQQSWYIPAGIEAAQFSKWLTVPQVADAVKASAPTAEVAKDRVYLAVPYNERNPAKAAGAEWDNAAKSWYAGPNADMTRLERWNPDKVSGQQDPAMSPKEEFADALESLGFLVSGEHPIMDGVKHRIPVEGDKRGESSGFYVGHLDGHPAGYCMNNRTKVDMKWKSKGYSLDPAEKAKLQAEAATKLAERAAEQTRLQAATAERITGQASGLSDVVTPTPYMVAKGIEPKAGVLTDKDGQKTYIPAMDVNGKLWSMQYIQEDGTKRFAKDSKKEGCFHPVGGFEAVAAAPVLVIAEGYATAASLSEAMGQATVAAFDSGNLPAVARALHEKFPDKPVIIAGDDDRHQAITTGNNPGRSKAEEAAKAVSGTAIFPVFAQGEGVYPANLPPITPQSFRAHEQASARLEAAQTEPDKAHLADDEKTVLMKSVLRQDQLDALKVMKSHTDFNDLATKSELGRDGIERQATAAVSQVLEARAKELQSLQAQRQEQNQQQRQEGRRGMRA
jgi:antirestriction protein ArdC/phage/plasmid primase-like uncharacterized protein